jgi:hypothetical protein
LVSTDSAEGQERMKWEKPYRFEQFPQMLYMGRERPDGVIELDARTKIVSNANELQAALEGGWRERPDEAIELVKAKLRRQSDAAAHRAYEDRNMSDAAKAEIAAAEAATPEQLAEVPVKKRRGRPPKNAAA